MIYSELESNRFKTKVYRLDIDSINIELLKNEIKENNPGLVIMRIPASEVPQMHQLELLKVPYLITDTLVYYNIDLTKVAYLDLKNKDSDFAIASEKDIPQLEKVISEIFKDYTNHYYSNPYLDKSDILRGYVQWALGHVNNEGKICFIAIDKNEKILGFAACAFEKNTAEGVIFGVALDSGGRGIYTDLIRHAHNYFKKNGFGKMKVSTQIQNYTVQRVWAKEGYLIDKAYITIHLNNFLNNNA